MPATARTSMRARSAARWPCDEAVTRPGGRAPGGEMRNGAASAIFAANRAQGKVAFDVRLEDGVTRRGRLHESGSLRVRFPSPAAEGLSAVFVYTAGGVAGGGRVRADI